MDLYICECTCVRVCVCVFSNMCACSPDYTSDGASSVCSGSIDAVSYLTPRQRRSQGLMSMPKTLALCHLALLWAREAITLADLLRSGPRGDGGNMGGREDEQSCIEFNIYTFLPFDFIKTNRD